MSTICFSTDRLSSLDIFYQARHDGPYTSEELEAMHSTRPPTHAYMPFSRLVTSFLEPLRGVKEGHGRKGGATDEERRNKLVNQLIDESSEYGPDVYPAIRLVAPELDVENDPSHVSRRRS